MENDLKKLLLNKKMPIIVSLPENRIDLAQSAIDAGADGLKFHINVAHRASGNEFKELDYYLDVFKEVRKKFSGPIGIVPGDDIQKVSNEDIGNLRQVGFNYFSLYAKDIPSKMLLQNELDKTVAVDDQFSPAKIHAIEFFGLQAIELSIVKKENYGKRLNFEDIVSYKAYRDNTNLPLVVASQKKLIPEDLSILNDIGINAVMLGAMTIGKTSESIFKTVSKFHKKTESLITF